MKDFGTSSDPRVQAQLDRLAALSLPEGRLGLETMRVLLGRLGDPQDRLPPVFHVAGTNGKGSTCAFLRAMLEADGKRVHVTTSPHLVRYNERIRLAGTLIEDGALAEVLAEVLDAAEGLQISFFETTIAAAFLAFSRTPADACVVEVGLGGRFDATNVLEADVLAACGIAALGIDHERFLLVPDDSAPSDPMARIGFEKAGIAKRGIPLVTLGPTMRAASAILEVADAAGAPVMMEGVDWQIHPGAEGFHLIDTGGQMALPLPTMPGPHQMMNAALAAAMVHYQDKVSLSAEAMAQGIRSARWPARLQQLGPGPLTRLAKGHDLWLDGGHNKSAGDALALHFADARFHLIIGMIEGKDPQGLIGPLAKQIASTTVVPVPDRDHYGAVHFGSEARQADDVPAALADLPDDGLPVLIGGSLYLAGEVLRLNNEIPE